MIRGTWGGKRAGAGRKRKVVDQDELAKTLPFERPKSYANIYYAENRERIRARRYGLREHQVADLKTSQAGSCAICHEPFGNKFVIDHCHASGRVRGLLCYGCNNALGLFRDNPVMLLRACLYLNETAAVSVRKVQSK